MSTPELPRPHLKLWRTRLHWTRSLRGLVTPIDSAPLREVLPPLDEVLPFGEHLLLEDHAYILHRDGTITLRSHLMTYLWRGDRLAQWDALPRVFNPRQYRSTIRKAVLHLPDGRSLPQKIERRTDQSGTHYINLAFRPLRPGVIAEIEEQVDHYQLDPIGPAMWGQFLLRTGAPCRHRRLTVAVAEPFTLHIRQHHGAADPTTFEHRGYSVRQWELSNVPGVPSDLMPHGRDFLPWIDFSTLPSWKPVRAHLEKELLPRTKNSQDVGELIGEITRSDQTPQQKLEAVFQHVAKQIRYGRPPAEWENRMVRDPGDVLAELRGDCKDKSALLVSLLDRIGVPAKIAVVTTSEGGRQPFLPSLRFNHAIVRADFENQPLWIDPAAGPFALGDLPQNVQGVGALLLDTDTTELDTVPLPRPKQHAIHRTYRAQMEPDGGLTAEVTAEFRGVHAAELRSPLLDMTADDRLKYLRQQAMSIAQGCEVHQAEFLDLEDLTRPLRLKYQFVLKPWARRVRNIWIVRIPWGWELEFGGTLSEKERQHPLPTPRTAQLEERYEIELPPGVRGYGLPYRRDVRNHWVQYRCWITVKEGKLIAQRRLRFREGIVQPDDYSAYRADWANCADADHTDVLLVQTARTDGAPVESLAAAQAIAKG